MGTHPIFESDFDCLTEKNGKLLKNRGLRWRVIIGRFGRISAKWAWQWASCSASAAATAPNAGSGLHTAKSNDYSGSDSLLQLGPESTSPIDERGWADRRRPAARDDSILADNAVESGGRAKGARVSDLFRRFWRERRDPLLTMLSLLSLQMRRWLASPIIHLSLVHGASRVGSASVNGPTIISCNLCRSMKIILFLGKKTCK